MAAELPSDPVPSAQFLCPKCKRSYRVNRPQSGRKYTCQICRTALQPAAELPETLMLETARPAPLTHAVTRADELQLKPFDDQAAQPDLLERLIREALPSHKILKEIARGGMGAVVLAEHLELRRKVAIKVMLPGGGAADAATARERFMREARAMAKLKHPHIIDVYEVGTVGGLTYFSMEYIEGRTLADVLAAESCRPEVGEGELRPLVDLIRKVARALAFAHSRGVIHRDIKPANIMLRDSNGEPVLMDFGLAKDVSAESVKLSVTGNVMGTPSYMSPEQAQGLATDERSDICSLGTVLYEALTQRTPFEGNTTIMTLYNVVNVEPEPANLVNPRIPAALARICAKAIQKDPSLRYASMDEFAGDLDRFMAGMAVNAQAPSVVRRALKFTRARKTALAAAAAGIVALVVLMIALSAGWLRWGKNAAGELRDAIAHGSVETRLLHVKTLAADLHEGRFPAGSPAHADALAALREAAADADASGQVAVEAIRALAQLKDTAAGPVLNAQLSAQRPVAVRREAVTALGALRKLGVASALLPVLRTDPALEVRLAALEALGDVVEPGTLVYLMELSVRGEPPALASAARAKLAQVRSPDSILALYTGPQAALVGQSVAKIGQQAADYERKLEEAMGELDPNTVVPARRTEPYEVAARKVKVGTRDERLQAAYDLGVLADARAEDVLLSALADTDVDVALAAAEALGKLPPLKGAAKLAEWLRQNNPAVRQAAARACGLIRPAPDGAALVSALQTEKQAPVQAELAQALGRLKCRPAVPALLALLSDGAPVVRIKAARALGAIGDRSAANGLVEALARGGDDSELKEELAGALSAVTGQTIGPDAARWRRALSEK